VRVCGVGGAAVGQGLRYGWISEKQRPSVVWLGRVIEEKDLDRYNHKM